MYKQRTAALSTLCIVIVDCDKRASRREVDWKRLVGEGTGEKWEAREYIGIFFFLDREATL